MNTPRGGLRVAVFLFAIFCLAHLGRLLAHVDVRIGGMTVPMWPSVVGAALAGCLSLWLWRLSSRLPRA